MTASINCGYVERKSGGQVWKWEKDGSGAAALVDKFKEIHARVVARHRRTGSGGTAGSERDLQRRGLCRQARRDAARFYSAGDAVQGGGYFIRRTASGGKFQFDFNDVLSIAHLSPGGFREDPLLKKASLALIMFAGFANGEGFDVDLDNIIIPVNYRGPQFLHNLGILRYSDALVTAMDAKKLFRETACEATEVRAAMLASERIYRLKRHEQAVVKEPSRFEWHHLDGIMWFGAKIFDKPADQLTPREAEQRKTLDGIGGAARQRSGFEGFGKRSREHMYMNTFWI